MKWMIIFAATILIFYGCCSSNLIEYPEPSSTAQDGSFISKTGVYQFVDKEYVADYGTITVPENRRSEKSRLIHLPVIRIHSYSQNNLEPVFGFVGGPGQSNMKFHPIDSLLYNHDFILVGYRGVDGSTVLECPEVKEAIVNSNEDLLSEESLREIGEAWAIAFDRFKSSGIDLNGYTIPETIEDMEAIRKAFNYKKINLISESYGTRIAYLYGVIHPKNIHRSVMIGVNPPGGFIYDPKITDQQIKYYSGLWAKDSVLAEQCPDLAATMQRVLNNMPRKWFCFSINPGKVKTVTFGMLYHRNTAAMVFDSYIAADKGDNSGLALMSIAFDYIFPDLFVWGDAATKAISADFDSSKINSILDQPDEILGSPMNKLMWGPLKYNHFPVELIPDSLRVPVNSDVETLLLSGSVDFANPPESATAFLSYLKNGRQIIMSEAGHVGDIRYLQLNATKSLIAEYINKGTVDTSKLKYVPMDFNVSWGFPTIAKASIGLISVVVILLAAGIIWIL